MKKYIGLLCCGLLLASASSFSADVGNKHRTEVLIADDGLDLAPATQIFIMPTELYSFELMEMSVFEFSAWKPKEPAAMFTSPNYQPVKRPSLKWRRARDGLSC